MRTNAIERPAAHEFDPHQKSYIDRVQGNEPLRIMRRQLDEVLDLLAGLSDEQALYRYQPDKWSVKEVIGHLLDTERVFVYRALSISRGETQSLPGFEQDDYVVKGGFDARSVDSLRREYEATRRATLAFFDNLDEAAWLRAGTANNVNVSVRALGYLIPGHEAHHLAVLRERYGLPV